MKGLIYGIAAVCALGFAGCGFLFEPLEGEYKKNSNKEFTGAKWMSLEGNFLEFTEFTVTVNGSATYRSCKEGDEIKYMVDDEEQTLATISGDALTSGDVVYYQPQTMMLGTMVRLELPAGAMASYQFQGEQGEVYDVYWDALDDSTDGIQVAAYWYNRGALERIFSAAEGDSLSGHRGKTITATKSDLILIGIKRRTAGGPRAYGIGIEVHS